MADVRAVNLVARRKAPTVPGEPRGIALVEMTHSTEAQAAIDALDGKVLNGRSMRVNEDRPKLHFDSTRDSGTRIIRDIECELRNGGKAIPETITFSHDSA
jgi:RNA recognition motif-containing protein